MNESFSLLSFNHCLLMFMLNLMLKYLKRVISEYLPLDILMSLQVVSHSLNIFQDTLNTAIDVTFLGLSIMSQYVGCLLLIVLKEVPAEGRSHHVQETTIFIFFLLFLFFLLWTILLLLSQLCLMLIYMLPCIFYIFLEVTIHKNIVFNILDDMIINMS